MLAVHLENGAVTTRDVPVPGRPEGFALLRLLCAGICNTDLELQRGYYGFSGTPGHEFVAEVVEADSRRLIGRRVVGEINLACTNCDWCRRGLGRHCPTRTVLGIVNQPGTFEEFFVMPERNLHVVPDSVSTERAVFTEALGEFGYELRKEWQQERDAELLKLRAELAELKGRVDTLLSLVTKGGEIVDLPNWRKRHA